MLGSDLLADDQDSRGIGLLGPLSDLSNRVGKSLNDPQGHVDHIFLAFLYLGSRFGKFTYGPITIDVAVVEDRVTSLHARPPGPLPSVQPPGHASVGRFIRALGRERAAGGRRVIDELHVLLALMRCNEGVPAEVFGELGVTPEAVEAFSRDGAPAHGSRRFLSPEEVATMLGVHVKTVRGWIRTGKLPASRLAGQRALRVRESDIDALLQPVDPEPDVSE